MSHLKNILVVTIISISLSSSLFANSEINKKTYEDKKGHAEKNIVIGSRVLATIRGEKIDAVVVNVLTKNKFFIRAWGNPKRVGVIRARKLRLKKQHWLRNKAEDLGFN